MSATAVPLRTPHSALRTFLVFTGERGITLIELLIASAISTLVIMLLGQVDMTRLYLTTDTKEVTQGQIEVAMAMAYMTNELMAADRVNLLDGPNATNIQFRVPTGTSFDAPGNYQWHQYRFDAASNELRFYEDTGAGCVVDRRSFDISSVDIHYQSEAPAPPGGDPPMEDNNVLEVVINGTRNEVTLRAMSYSNLNASGWDSGSGMAPAGVSNPASACTT